MHASEDIVTNFFLYENGKQEEEAPFSVFLSFLDFFLLFYWRNLQSISEWPIRQ